MTKFLGALICISLFPLSVMSQERFNAEPIDARNLPSLSEAFTSYSLYRINTVAIKESAFTNRSQRLEIEIQFPGVTSWNLSLLEHDILHPGYKLIEASSAGNIIRPRPEFKAYSGYVTGFSESKVRLTLADNLLYGIVKAGNTEYFIEPLRYLVPGSAEDIFVLYETSNVIQDGTLKCGVTEMMEHESQQSPVDISYAGTNCVQTQVAIASDESMFLKYGSVAAVELHNIGVFNNVLWDYTNAQFNNNIELTLTGQYISTAALTDPLTPAYTGTHASTILSNFRAWGQAGNFGLTYDVAQFWTNRNIDGDGAGGNASVIGLAYVGVICSNSRYHILEDFAGTIPTGSGYSLRVLTTHELGHNFNASHDASGSPYIMAPSVQNTTTWSAVSIASVDGHVAGVGCLAQCSTAGAPIADFISSPDAVCTGTLIQFTDHSLHGPTVWNWSFPGGTPSTSSVRNPATSYAATGIMGVSLTVTNINGSDSYFKPILVSPAPATACVNAGTGTTNAGVYSFSLGNINSSSGGTAVDGNKYVDNSCTSTTVLTAGTTYSASATVGTTNPSNQFNLVQLFIDYNNDGDFADANEAVYSSPSCYIGTHTFSFTTPVTPPVTNQFLRARLIAKDCVGGVNSCYNVTNGQVEDYSVYFASGSLVSVNLISFGGIHKNGSNLLNWQTAAEINHSHFEIERSFDGINFSRAGTVNGTNALGGTYTFTDDLSGVNENRFYYRLKIVDQSGEFKFSNIVLLEREVKSGILVYPNPVKRGMNIQITGNESISGFELLNELGQVMYRGRNNLTGSILIPVSQSWSPGYYALRIFQEDKVVSKKIRVY